MRSKLFAVLALAAAPVSSAAFLGISIDEITGTLPPAPGLPANLRTFHLYALFDGPGEVNGSNRVNSVLAVGQPTQAERWGLSSLVPPTGQFFQADPADGAQPGEVGAPDIGAGAARGLYDTFVTIGRATQNPGGGIVDATMPDPDFGMFNGNLLAGDPAVGLGAGHDRIGGGWFNSTPQNLQGAAQFNPSRNRFETLLGQFSVNDVPAHLLVGSEDGPPASIYQSEVFAGQVTIFTQAAGSGADANTIILNRIGGPGLQPPVPAPGALSLFALAAMTRRRR